jgi:hypothetical protein
MSNKSVKKYKNKSIIKSRIKNNKSKIKKNKSRIKNNKSRIKNKSENSKTRKFLYHPDDPKKSFDVYIDKNPRDTIHIKYKTVDDVKTTIRKLERLYKDKKYTHKRIWQVGMIMKVRLEVLQNKKPKEYHLAKKYFDFLSERTKMDDKERRKYKINLFIVK